ncbi:MAG: membrane protein insertase YidC [bacterium]|nr:membrane protein insertase YidC [bacterium]
MEKRVALAIFISALILLLYNIRYYQNYELTEVKKAQEAERVFPSSQIKETSLPSIPEIKLASIDIPKKDLYIDTELIDVQLTPRGSLQSWKLKRYLEKDRKPIEMIHSQDLSCFPLDLSLQNGKNLVVCDFISLDRYTKQFIYQVEDIPDVRLEKRLTFFPDRYEVRVDLKMENPSLLQSSGSLVLWGGFIKEQEDQKELIEQVYSIDNQIHKVSFKKKGPFDKIMVSLGLRKKEEPRAEIKKITNFSWSSQSKRYFSTIILPESIFQKEVHFKKGKDGVLSMALVLPNISTGSFKFYIGPKEYESLEIFEKGCERIVYSGWLAPFSRLILKTLKLFYLITRNYGVAIILLAIVIKIILFPLNQISFRSMKSMQELQPHMNRIRQKYRNDREKLNREIIALYKRHGINPVQSLTGGCLPMFLQLPILFALFTTFRTAIELRGSPFIFWLKDLSMQDPYYILPILMGVSMYIQQRIMTPVQADPKQPNMAIFMTTFFTFICFGFPSGLILYWLVQNILTIGQQYLIIRKKKSVARNQRG